MYKREILFKMELKIVENFKKVLKKEGIVFKDDNTLAAFERASLEFENLVKRGLVKRRGYNLMTIDKKHLYFSNFNTNEDQ